MAGHPRAEVGECVLVVVVFVGATPFAATKIGANEIKANAITSGKIKKEAVTERKIKAGAVGNSRLGNGSVSALKLAANAVAGAALADGSVTSAKLAPNAVTGAALADNSVTAAKLVPNSVTAQKIAGWSVGASKLGSIRRVTGESTPTSTAGALKSATVECRRTLSRSAAGLPGRRRWGTPRRSPVFAARSGRFPAAAGAGLPTGWEATGVQTAAFERYCVSRDLSRELRRPGGREPIPLDEPRRPPRPIAANLANLERSMSSAALVSGCSKVAREFPGAAVSGIPR